MAMEEWVENPHAETALSNILPCVDQRTTNQTLIQSKQIINGIVTVVNQFIYTYANTNPSPGTPYSYNQSGPLMPPLCYPFDAHLNVNQCGDQEVSIENALLVRFISFSCLASFLFIIGRRSCLLLIWRNYCSIFGWRFSTLLVLYFYLFMVWKSFNSIKRLN